MPIITCTVCEWHFRGAKYRINTTLQYKNLCHRIYFLVFKYKFHSSVQPHVYYYIPTMLWFWLLYIDSRSRTDEDILWLMSSVNCCNMKCLRKLSIEDINYCESSFKNVEQTTRRNLILGYLHTHSKTIHSGGFETEFYAGGKSVCKDAWLLAHDVQWDSFQQMRGTWGAPEHRKVSVKVNEHRITVRKVHETPSPQQLFLAT